VNSDKVRRCLGAPLDRDVGAAPQALADDPERFKRFPSFRDLLLDYSRTWSTPRP
jgi:hypothetical protein